MTSTNTPADTSPAVSALQRREIAVLKAELRDLAHFTQSVNDELLMRVAQGCLERVVGVVHRYGGTVQSLAGNAILVFFGVQASETGDHVERSVQCAVELQMCMRDINNDQRADRVPEMYLGMGVASGCALVAGVGGPLVQSIVAMGDVVLKASHLCAFSLRGQVLIGEEVYERAWGQISAASPMQIHVKTRQKPITARELVAVPTKRLKVPRQEFRRSHRVHVQIPCQYRVESAGVVSGEAQSCQIRDLAYHGAMLELPEPAPLHGALRLSFDLALTNYQVRDVEAFVITTSEKNGVHLAGVEFRSANAEVLEQLRVLVQRLVAAQ